MRIISGKHRGTKLYTLDGLDTRPTLDRVKEPLFSIINFDIPDATVLDLFSGSGAIGLELISRGAKRAILCDNSSKAIQIIEKNVEKIKSDKQIDIIHNDYLKTLELLKRKNEKIDIVFLDPPYMTDFACVSCEKIAEYNLLNEHGIIIIETDRKDVVVEKIKQKNLFEVYDERKYGRANLIFLKLKKNEHT